MLWPAAVSRYQVLSLSGVGGQGKTTLLNQLAQRMSAFDCRDRPLCRLDFGVPQHRSMVEGLFFLRNQLRTQGVPTHAFDVAFARHFALTRPGRDIKREYPELYRFAEDSLFGELVDVGADAVRDLPGGKLAVTLLTRVSNRVHQWYSTRGVAILSQLDALSSQQLGLDLPMFLGFDLLEFVTEHPRRRPVLLLDTYEALWRDTGTNAALDSTSGDLWVRRLAEECPGCLWVLAGRHRLKWAQHDADWAQYIVERELGALTSNDADALLDAGSIQGDGLRAALRQVAAGHPLSLALGIRYCQMKASGGTTVTEHDLPRTQQEVLDRFFDHLDPTVRGLIRVLAVPTLVRVELWPHLARSAFPIFDLYAASALLEEVFFRPVAEGEYAMHDRVREHLLEDMSRREADLLRRARLAVFDFYDQAAAGGSADAPDLGGTVRQRDGCLLEAAKHLADAAPERYIRWCEQRLERGRKGSLQRRALIARADALLGTIGQQNLLDAAILARLRLCVDPWDETGLALLERLTAVTEGQVLHETWIAPLRQIALDMQGANPSRLPLSLVRALLACGVEDIDLALIANDLSSATRWAEREVIQAGDNDIDVSWSAWAAIARSARSDLCEIVGERLGRREQDLPFWVTLTRIVDALCFEGAPALGLVVMRRALQVADCEQVVHRLDGLDLGVVSHQLVLTVCHALLGAAESTCARQLVDRRFDDAARCAFTAGVEQLLATGGESNALATEEGRQFIEAFEQKHGMQGFVQGYLEVALDTAPNFSRRLSESVLAAVRAEIDRANAVYRTLGGRPNVATLRKNRFHLGVNERSELFLLFNDALILWRSIDWLAFDTDWRLIFGDARQGQRRQIGLSSASSMRELDIGDGATLLLVLVDDAGTPVEGEYKRFYGRVWRAEPQQRV